MQFGALAIALQEMRVEGNMKWLSNQQSLKYAR